MRFQIGQHAYMASWTLQATHVTCPDCCGTGRLRVIFHDESQVSIGCTNCQCGYDPPSGRIQVYDRTPEAKWCTITGIEIEHDKVTWKTTESYRVDDENLFEDKDACMVRARAMAEQADREERDRIALKEKDTRSWAWNAKYHRDCIKRAQKDIEYHTAKLNVASLKAKEDRAS